MRAVLTAALIWLASCAPGSAERFIALSDIHLDPTADPGLVRELVAAQVADWASILERGRVGFGRFGRDATWPLVRSALDQMRRVEPEPAFLLLTGDLLAHGFRAKFTAAAPQAGAAAYDSFVIKTVEFLAAQIMARFPGRRVFLALGNNDDFCGDYRLSPDGRFLVESEAAAQALLGLDDARRFAREWDEGFGYELPNGSIDGLRMIFLNSVFFSPGYDEACAPEAPRDPGLAAMDWLAGRLGEARDGAEKVWLFLHIPPGGDAYATLEHGACRGTMQAMWTAPETERFLELIREYAGTVGAVFAGHTHMDEFRLLGAPAEPDGVVLVTPAISPVFGQNPGFHVYEVDPSGRLTDRATWALTNLAAIGPEVAPTWQLEYRFDALWGLEGLERATLAELAGRITTDPATRADWYSVFRVGRTAVWGQATAVADLPPVEFSAYRCAITAVSPAAYRACVCGR
ncbi:MAG: metallophosphoesterase [Geminicoccaceae bacterium]